MTQSLHDEIAAILKDGQDMTIATVRPDGWPQATTVSYAADGTDILFGCGPESQKARNLAHDDRVSITVNLPYKDWSQIRGVSLSGRARRITDPDELWRAGELFLAKFPEVAQYTGSADQPCLFRVVPETVSVLNYAKGFGHTDLVKLSAVASA
ncbi:pyridoxamine 5'-phosphate oxidase family protein [Phenylobacterium sp.]|uniref:pyridoxamine 5'-phosphate oxidase family protein n=1 Tax=Phenylobacterium sp. TaxID=1871053 RepID=UPI003918D88C